ncbi:terminase [Rhodococcus sp. SGAir0479]|nr:terminase [Rhodococcus sp. SGAir0479]
MSADYVVDFPTLAHLQDAWVQAHCSIPTGHHKGEPFVSADWQFYCTAQHYRVRPKAKWIPENPLRSTAFVYRRSLIVGPQKCGKGPWSATIVCIEAVGPSLFAGWAEDGEVYRCADHGCDCGFEHEYRAGEPKGMPHPSPLIQLTATSEDQVDNVYDPLKTMIRNGPLSELMAIREGFIRLPGDECRIDVVTASANSRLGNPITFVLQDENGLYTKENKMIKVASTQRRGVAGMQGRSIATTNMWDPAENSDAQQTFEGTVKDVFKFLRTPPAGLSWNNKRDRRKILRYVYDGCSWIELDAIDAEAMDLMQTNPAEAQRFYGNMKVSGMGAWLPDGLWESAYARA